MHPAIEAFFEELKQRSDVMGILLFGSRARGDNRPDSDVDLIVIVSDGLKRSVEYRQGQTFEIIYTSEQRAFDFWQNNRDDAAGLWETAKILYDRDGTMARLREKTLRMLAEGKKALDISQIEHLRFDAEDQLRCVEAILESDAATASMLLTNKVFALTELFFDLRQIWTPPPKRRLAKLKAISPELNDLLVEFYDSAKTLGQRTNIARKILAFVFAM